MKNTLVVLLSLVSVCAFAQVDYDKYTPKKYSPKQYIPISTGAPLEILPYEEMETVATVENLVSLIDRIEKHPEMQSQLLGNLAEYKKLASKYMDKGKQNENVGKKKSMKHFQEDWILLDRYIYERNCESARMKKESSVRDSLSHRKRFVEDSLKLRESFVNDSLTARNTFIEDSLYRADFRKKGNYDYVEFDGPHGKPGLCYRKGKIVDGTTYNQYGLVEKVYWHGELIQDYSYNDEYLVIAKKKDDFNNKGFPEVYDHVKNAKTIYTLSGSAILSVEYYDMRGIRIKRISYEDGSPDSETQYTYFPDNKTVKQSTYVDYHPSSDSLGETVVTDYYSDGNERQYRVYRTLSNGNRVLRKAIIKKDGYDVIEYYDFNGEFERSETKSQYNPYLGSY